MEKISSRYRGELKSIIRPVFNLGYWSGLIFFAVVFFEDDFVFDIKMVTATLALESVLIPFMALIIGVFTFVYKITIFDDGISSYDPWGTLKCDFMKYSDMSDIKIKSVFGYKYYFIHSEDNSKTLWIPFNVKNKDGFIDALRSIVNSNHPIIKRIETLTA